jgi:hypothetical protein
MGNHSLKPSQRSNRELAAGVSLSHVHCFNSLFKEDTGKLSLKAFLASGQCIPALGNGGSAGHLVQRQDAPEE